MREASPSGSRTPPARLEAIALVAHAHSGGRIAATVGGGPLTLVARQPILEVSGRVHAHELLFRGAGDAKSGGGERATASVLVSTFLDARLDDVAAGKPVWVNVEPRVPPGGRPAAVPDPAASCSSCSRTSTSTPSCSSASPSCARRATPSRSTTSPGSPAPSRCWTSPRTSSSTSARSGSTASPSTPARFAGHDLVILAEKVETESEATAAIAAGATLLQGFHFARPEAVPERSLSGARAGGGAQRGDAVRERGLRRGRARAAQRSRAERARAALPQLGGRAHVARDQLDPPGPRARRAPDRRPVGGDAAAQRPRRAPPRDSGRRAPARRRCASASPRRSATRASSSGCSPAWRPCSGVPQAEIVG